VEALLEKNAVYLNWKSFRLRFRSGLQAMEPRRKLPGVCTAQSLMKPMNIFVNMDSVMGSLFETGLDHLKAGAEK
jgi:hypothetical protein